VNRQTIAVHGPLAQSWAAKNSRSFQFLSVDAVDLSKPLPGPLISADLEVLLNAKQLFPEQLCILMIDEQPGQLIATFQRALAAEISQYLSIRNDEKTLTHLLDSISTQTKQRATSRHLLTELRANNQRLRKFTENLEQEVLDRTRGEVESREELKRRVAKMNELIRFMMELSFHREMEDVLELVRREVRVFHEVFEPVLAFQTPQGESRIVYFRNGNVVQRRARYQWPEGADVRQQSAEDRQYIANEIGRPVGRIIFLPLRGVRGAFFFEQSLESAALPEFMEFLQERWPSLSLAVGRLLLEADLRSTTHLWEQTFDSIEEPVAIIDSNFQLLRCNSYFSEDMILESCYKHFANREHMCTGCPLGLSHSTQLPQTGQVRRDLQAFEVHSYPIYFDGEEASAGAFVNHYVDRTKALELKSQLVQTEKMVALGHLAGHIAHELNNPLSGIRGLTQVLIRTLEPDLTMRADLIEVEKAAARCQTIIQNLLEFSRKQNTSQLSVVDMNEILRKTLPLLKTALTPFRTDIVESEAPLHVRASPQLLQQVIFNIVNNACQATDEGGQIRISLKADGPWVELVVADSGAGIPDALKDQIFHPFVTTKPPGAGTGLGLSMCRNVVESFNGHIFFESEQGRGTQFFIRLPKVDRGLHEDSDRG
jgi:signal transduction histidine kinase